MHVIWTVSGVLMTVERPSLCAKAMSAEGGGGWAAAQASESKAGFGMSDFSYRDCCGGNRGRFEAATDGRRAAAVAKCRETMAGIKPNFLGFLGSALSGRPVLCFCFCTDSAHARIRIHIIILATKKDNPSIPKAKKNSDACTAQKGREHVTHRNW